MPVTFLVTLELDPEGDGTVPTEEDVSEWLSPVLFDTYPISAITVKAVD